MEMVPLTSTNLAAVGYDPDSLSMMVQFRQGSIYTYANVEPETYAAMMASGDPGAYFAQVVKPQRDRYSFTRIS